MTTTPMRDGHAIEVTTRTAARSPKDVERGRVGLDIVHDCDGSQYLRVWRQPTLSDREEEEVLLPLHDAPALLACVDVIRPRIEQLCATGCVVEAAS